MNLHYREYGNYSEHKPTLILLHGLLGSSLNWQGISSRLAQSHHLIVPDLRNHGRSPHHPDVGYPALSDDLLELIEDQGLEQALLIGHSMGGKTAMWLALEQPEKVSGLVVVDIAPVNYPNRFGTILEALCGLDLGTLENREAADRFLAGYLDEPALRQYLLQNLVRSEEGWCWRVNLTGLARGMNEIVTFPQPDDGRQYPGETLFIYGDRSDYLQPGYEKAIRERFPYARLRAIAGAGHWVYNEQPEAFVQALRPYLAR